MVRWSGRCSSCILFVFRYCSGHCIMSISIITVAFFALLYVFVPVPVSASIRSWFCGTCTVCQVCPPCIPQVNVVPRCECHENLNNCNCQCLTHQNLHTSYLQWFSPLGTSYNNTYATQLNNHLLKRRLLISLVGLALLNLLLLFLLGTLIVCSPALLRRWNQWHSTFQLRRQTRLRQKLNRLTNSPTVVELAPTDPLFSIARTLDTNTKLIRNLTHELQSNHVVSQPPISTISSPAIH